MHGREWTIRSEKKSSCTLVVFLRAPEPGRVKTRLAKDVGDENALALYKGFVSATLDAVDAWRGRHGQETPESRAIRIAYYPENKQDMVAAWLGRERQYIAQSGKDLGRRMANAMAGAFDHGAGRVALVGTDIPQIRSGLLAQAFEALNRSDVVIGPSLDGGYWLIGTRRETFTPAIFENIDWGTSSVCAATTELCQAHGLAPSFLEPLRDVDTLADLNAVRRQDRIAGRLPGTNGDCD